MVNLKKELFLGLVILVSVLFIASSGISAPNPCYMGFENMIGEDFDSYDEIDLNDYVRVKFGEDSACEDYKLGDSDIYIKRESDDSIVTTLKHNTPWKANESGEFYLYSEIISGINLHKIYLSVSETEQDSPFENFEILSPECGYKQNFGEEGGAVDLQFKFTDKDDLIRVIYYEFGRTAVGVDNSESPLVNLSYTFDSSGEKSLFFEISDSRGNTKKIKINIILYELTPAVGVNYLAACIDPSIDNTASGSMITIDGSNSVGFYVPTGGSSTPLIDSENLIFNWTFSDGLSIIKTKAQGGDVVYRKFRLGDIGKEFWVKLDLTTDNDASQIPDPD